MKKAEKAHLAAVAGLGCIACRTLGYMRTPAEIHHIRHGMGSAQRNDNFHVLPLCPAHHNRPFTYGVAFHAGKQIWEARFGTEQELLEKVKLFVRD